MNARYYLQFQKGFRRIYFYICNFSTYFLPNYLYRRQLRGILASLPQNRKREIEERVAYYNRMPECRTSEEWTAIRSFRYPFGKKEKFSMYFFDLYSNIRFFSPHSRFRYEFGDVTREPSVPAFVKSRPIGGATSNAVLLKLNRVRHFHFIRDSRNFREKKDMLVSRNVVRQPHRRKLLEMYYGHPLCDIGQINTDTAREHPEWVKGYLTLEEQLQYKFICCIEGNDVASNLKWVMSSNSVPVMPRPRYETWFMEGKLVPGYHYIEIKPDYSDLIEKIEYYISHLDEAELIIEHAHEYIRRFKNKKVERAISLLVIQKYLQRSGQIPYCQ